jgi:16S rRNA U1498 N3-methylase RsmE
VGLVAEAQARAQAVGPDLDLVIALVKRARLETIVEKAAELGARRVRPVITERTNADHTRVDRLQAIATEASEQTGRLDVPEVLEPVKLEKLIAGWEPGRRLLFCDEAGDALGDPDRAGGRVLGQGTGRAARAALCDAGDAGAADPARRHRRDQRADALAGGGWRLALAAL